MNPFRIVSVTLTGLLASALTAQVPEIPAGASPEDQAAIDRGLAFLVRSQNRDGSWRAAGGYGNYPTAMTALAGMALLGSGSTPTRGPHFLQVRRAKDFLVQSQQANGLITAPAEESRSLYGHGFSTMFLAQVYGMEEDPVEREKIGNVLRRAVELTASCQSRDGGWLYTPDDAGDEGSVTITQVQALRACRDAGISVPPDTIKRAIEYIRGSANPDGGVRYSKSSGGSGRAPITAAAVCVLYNAGSYDDPIAERAFRFAKDHLAVRGSGGGHHFYAHLYLAQAYYQRGGEEYLDYQKRMAKWLRQSQNRTDGSWQGDNVGSTYGTSIALTILQLPWAQVPIYQR